MPFSNRKFNAPFFSFPQEVEPVMVENVHQLKELDDQPLPTASAVGGAAVFVRTEAGMAEIAKRSMRVDFRHRMMLMEVDDFSTASRYFASFGGQGAAILQSLLEQGFIAHRQK
jgi:hypothetical protein